MYGSLLSFSGLTSPDALSKRFGCSCLKSYEFCVCILQSAPETCLLLTRASLVKRARISERLVTLHGSGCFFPLVDGLYAGSISPQAVRQMLQLVAASYGLGIRIRDPSHFEESTYRGYVATSIVFLGNRFSSWYLLETIPKGYQLPKKHALPPFSHGTRRSGTGPFKRKNGPHHQDPPPPESVRSNGSCVKQVVFHQDPPPHFQSFHQ